LIPFDSFGKPASLSFRHPAFPCLLRENVVADADGDDDYGDNDDERNKHDQVHHGCVMIIVVVTINNHNIHNNITSIYNQYFIANKPK